MEPLISGAIDTETAFGRALEPFRGFMMNRVEADTFESLASLRPSRRCSTRPTRRFRC